MLILSQNVIPLLCEHLIALYLEVYHIPYLCCIILSTWGRDEV